MNTTFLYIAAAISFISLIYHVMKGGKFILQPILDADLRMVPKHTMVFSWRWGTTTMAVLTFCYFAPVIRLDLWPLAILATVYGYILGAISFWIMSKNKFRFMQMPQWAGFWLASLSGVLAWGL